MLYLGLNEGFAHNHNIPNVKPVGAPIMVEQYGFAIPVESWAKWVCIDWDGLIYLFEAEPLLQRYVSGQGCWVMGSKGLVRCAGEVDLEGCDWSATLVRL